MKTENLDKLLVRLSQLIQPLKVAPLSLIMRVVDDAYEHTEAMPKMVAFVTVNALMAGAQSMRVVQESPRRFEATTEIVKFSGAVIFYYMLKGAGCEAEIADHRELDVIMEILK